MVDILLQNRQSFAWLVLAVTISFESDLAIEKNLKVAWRAHVGWYVVLEFWCSCWRDGGIVLPETTYNLTSPTADTRVQSVAPI